MRPTKRALFFLLTVALLWLSQTTIAKPQVMNIRNIRKTVHNPRQSAFLYFHDAKSQDAMGVWERLEVKCRARRVDDLVFGTVDLSIYQMIGKMFKVPNAPAFVLYTKSNKTGRLRFVGEPTLHGLEAFLQEHGVLTEDFDAEL